MRQFGCSNLFNMFESSPRNGRTELSTWLQASAWVQPVLGDGCKAFHGPQRGKNMQFRTANNQRMIVRSGSKDIMVING